MIKNISLVLGFLLAVSFPATSNAGNNQGLNWRHGYACNQELLIIISTEIGWGLWKAPEVEVYTTYDGFMLVDQSSGTDRFLRKLQSGLHILEVRQASRTKRYDCSYISYQ